jgi:hypothetical protein
MANLLTKADIAAIRNAEDIVIHLNHKSPNGTVKLVKRADRQIPFDADKDWTLSANVIIGGYASYSDTKSMKAGEVSCFAMIGIYHEQGHHVSSILKTLRVGDELSFVFIPDWGCNGYLAKHGLHCDVLALEIRRKHGERIKTHSFNLDKSTCEDNTARMIRGVAPSKAWIAAREEYA